MCWRTYFLRRVESLAKGTHYNICACARKETTEGGKKTRRYGRALHDTRVSACSTSGSRHVWHPGLGMHDTRVSDTRKRLTGLTAQEENNTDTYKEKKYKQKKWILYLRIFLFIVLYCKPIILFLNSILHFLPTIVCVYSHWQKIPPYTPFFFSHFLIYVLLTLQTTCCITFSASLDSFCTMKPSYKLPE